MNQSRRKRLDHARELLKKITVIVEEVLEKEDGAFENVPIPLQNALYTELNTEAYNELNDALAAIKTLEGHLRQARNVRH
jgi:hypothetical protein